MPKVIVLAGGPDAEREVSLMSGTAIAAALREHGGFDVEYCEIDRLNVNDLRAMVGDVFFPALHGPWGEGGPLQELLEADGRPFVASGSQASADSMDKMKTKAISEEIGVPTPPAAILTDANTPCPLDLPLVFKPIDDGSSVDTFICHTSDELTRQRRAVFPRRARMMVERFIPGRELTVGVIGGEVSSLIEIIPTVEFYDYEAKYTRHDTQYTVNPDLPEKIAQQMRDDAHRLYHALGCRDLARIDFRVDDVTDPANPTCWMLEVNTMPGFTNHSLVPMGAVAGGIPMPELCANLIQMALSRSR